MKQSEIFLKSEAKAWFERNKEALPVTDDPLINTLKTTLRKELIAPRSLEVGCANGWRVKQLREEWDWKAYGIDPLAPDDISPATEHWNEWKYIFKGIASDLRPMKDNCFDIVMYGFCLYLCDPDDYFKIAAEGDRVLKDGGYLVIYDFHADHPAFRPYSHCAGVLSRKMDWSRLWLAHPYYIKDTVRIFNKNDERTRVTILKKLALNAFVQEAP